MKKVSIVLVSLTLFITCTKEEITPRPYPRVITGPIDNITSEGALFHGEIIFTSSEIIDHGFIWSTSDQLTLQSAEKFSLGEKHEKGPFELRVEGNLAENVKYYVKAYAISDEYSVYGNTVEFVSLGSKAPKVLSFRPSTATWGDTIVIIGNNFSLSKINNETKFDQIKAQVISNSFDSIVCVVPQLLSKERSNISVSFLGNEGISEDLFQLITPVINSVTPKMGSANTTVTITGEYFSQAHSKVYFNGVEATISQASATEIVCLVPEKLPAGEVKLLISTGSDNLHAAAIFASEKPRITNVFPLLGTYNDVLTIQGVSFAPDVNVNTVKFGEIDAQLISATTTEIKVKVPMDLATPTHQISLTSGSEKIIYPNNFSLLPPAILSISTEEMDTYSIVSILGNNFSAIQNEVLLGGQKAQVIYNSQFEIEVYFPIEPNSHDLTLQVTSSEQSTMASQTIPSKWMKMQVLPKNNDNSENLPVLLMFIEDDTFVLATSTLDNSYALFYHEPLANAWIEKSAPPFDANSLVRPFTFSFQNKGYVGGSYYHLWEYNLATDEWTRKANLPIQHELTLGFAINDKGYVCVGLEREFEKKKALWEYNPILETWLQKKRLSCS